MELFDFIKVLFSNSSEYTSLTPGEKRKQYFMTQRRCAIQFPEQANALQHQRINQSAVMDFWHSFLTKQYNYMPKWMYTKGVKKTQEVKEKKLSISNETIKEYCKYMKLDPKSVKDALYFYENEMVAEIKQFELLLKQK